MNYPGLYAAMSFGKMVKQMWNLPTLLLILHGIWAESTEIYQPNCREALGMHSGLIKDESISASSAYDVPSVGPHNSRIRTEKAGGAWCPKTQIAHNVYEYLQIDLGEVKVITLVETQGRFGNGQGQEYAQQYMLEYQRNVTGTWIRYYNKFGKELFKGNSNTYIAELRHVNPPIIARRVRFVPYSRHPRTICMRVELYGCPWNDGLVSYNMRQGDMRGTELQLFDFRYDGTNYDDHLVGGLGQLTDLEEGITNFRLDQDATGKKGYEWVGWKNDSMHSGPVKIYFNFDSVRNFSFARIHCNNMFTKGIRVFGMAKLYFSVGEDFYQEEPVVFEYMKDSLIEYARRVIIPIPHRVAKKIKMELYFAARWILISEVKFESEPVKKPVPFELPPQDRIHPDPMTSTTQAVPTIASTSAALRSPSTTEEAAPVLNVIPQHKSKQPEDYKEERRQGFVPVETPLEESNAVPRGAIIHPEPHGESGMQEEHIGIIIGTLAALILLLFAVAVFIIIRRQHKKKQTSAYGTYEKQNINNKNVDDLGKMAEVNGMLASYHMYNAIACSDSTDDDTIQRLKMKQTLAESPDAIDKKDISTFKPATTPMSQKDVPSSPLYVKLPPESATFPRPTSTISAGGRTPPAYPPPPIPPPPHLADLLKVVDLPTRGGSLQRANSIQLVEFPRENLVFVEKLGDGEFGEVHQCEAFLGKDRHQSKSLPVVVKVLQRSADLRAREAFLKEAEILAALKDPNIAMVIGVSTQTDPIFMILEYSKHGDLHQFLRQRNYAEDVPVNDDTALTYGCQIHLAIQVASGMKYLESLNMVHRDLAARNCLVTHNFTVKIGDLGASRILYDSDYHRLDGRTRLPLRWMAWEAAILGKFSHKSDVWSFAVTLWEILALARERPFSSMTHQQVITNFQRIFNNDTMQVYLPQPLSCPREIYDLMCECWNKEESMRPTFREIHMFLQRKNMGYNPAEDIYMKPWA